MIKIYKLQDYSRIKLILYFHRYNMDIYDKKSKEELQKHRSNFYLKSITNRKNKVTNFFDNKNLTNFFNVNIKKFTGFEGHYYYSGIDPLVSTALELIENNSWDIDKYYLYKYFENFQPKTYGEVYHLSKNNKLHQIESTNFFHPWIHQKPTNKFRLGLFGPKDITAVEHRITRLKNLINNINNYGYIPSKSDIIEGYILLKDHDYRFLITSGHHRVAVLTAMHMKNSAVFNELAVKFDDSRVKFKIVKEDHVLNWPGVKSKYLSKEDALEMFNKYFY